MHSVFSTGDKVTLTALGADYGLEGSCEVVTRYTYSEGDDSPYIDQREFFDEGATGEVVMTRDDHYESNYLVRFDNDPVDGRMWWMCCDEIAKEEQ